MVSAVESGGLGLTDQSATAIYGIYTAAVYLLALPGGWIADRLLGAQRSVFWGGCVIACGHFVLAIPAEASFYIGLALVASGTGLLKPNISAIVGELYSEEDKRRDGGFTIFYMGINLGAMLGPLICGGLGQSDVFGWHWGFGAAGVGMVLGLIQYSMGRKTLGGAGLAAHSTAAEAVRGWKYLIGGVALTTSIILLGVTGIIPMNPVSLATATAQIISAVFIIYFIYVLFMGGLTLNEKKRTGLIFVLCLASAFFWSGFEQAGSSLNLFADRYTDNFIPALDFEVPSSWYQSLNAFFIICFAPVFSWLWVGLAARQLDPSSPLKFGFGLILLGAGFAVMVGAANVVTAGNQAAPYWLILTYLLHTLGELCLSPVGLSAISRLAPRKFTGQMMGLWFCASALGNIIAGLLAGRFSSDAVSDFPGLYTQIVIADTPEETAAEFVERIQAEMVDLDVEAGAAYWVRSTYITEDTAILAAKAGERQLELTSRAVEQAKEYIGTEMDDETARAIKLLMSGTSMPAPDDAALRAELARIATEMEGMYGAGEDCNDEGECRDLGDLEEIMSGSRSYDELLDAWQSWRRVSPPMRPMYERFVEITNQGAKEFGYDDLGAMWKSGYDMDTAEFETEVERLWSQVEPLYEELHCHVRAELNQVYGDDLVSPQGPIPAHLLGNMWSQTWSNIYDLVEPYPGVSSIDISSVLEAQDYDAVAMTEVAEGFFTSLGLPELPDSFWEKSMLTKPEDRDVVCHASAWDLDNGADPRIKQCVEPTGEQLETLHHELGHIYYYLMYKDQPYLFKGGAHDGFHEAIGDTIVLSMTPEYLQEKGFLDQVVVSEEATINDQMRLALDKIAFLPFGKLMDQWRWKVFSGEISADNYNAGWWELRNQYQGIAAPIERTESDFDPGAKFHIPANVPYTRYFLSFVMQFQFHKSLCEAAGYQGPLSDCSIYGNQVAGEKLGNMLSMGASEPWPEAMEAMTGQRSMDASAIIDYFDPLMGWLAEQNEGRTCGCPEVALDSSNPLRGMGEVTAVATGFISTEGPVWHQASGSLIFSDIPGDTIYSLDTETGALSRLRDPSSNANGLALDASGGLLAAEQLTRSITRMNLDTGEVTSFIAALNVGGQERRFNSPNDMTIHNNGGVYFTDPPFGLRGREDQRELDFNGVFLRRPGGAIELIKALGVDENPNGIILNPDQTVLYLAVSHDVSGPILAFDVDADGNLSNEREFARAQNSDGMAIDTDGNLYVATRTAVQVYAPDGSCWLGCYNAARLCDLGAALR
eukprot:g4249.t1